MSPSGGKFGESKATYEDAFIRLVLVARNILLPKQTITSEILGRPFLPPDAIIREFARFCTVSFLFSVSGRIAPLTTIGFARFSNIKLKALAVYARVSVGCQITNPLKQSYRE
jgi:hypothetical protein